MSDDFDFTPIVPSDPTVRAPDVPDGTWSARPHVKKGRSKDSSKPQLQIRWELKCAVDSEENKAYEGRSCFDRVTFFSPGDKGYDVNARTIRDMTAAFGLPKPDLSTFAQGKWDSLEPWIAALESEDREIHTLSEQSKDGDVWTRVRYTKPRNSGSLKI
jgi:hypothetical protein